jgi:uroporphyrinogen decarboxylase
MTRRELVQRAISFDRPSRIPVWYWNADRDRSDIHSYELFPYKGGVNRSEWGYVWENLGDGTLGQPKKPVIPTWDLLESFEGPVADTPGRFAGVGGFFRRAADRYRAVEMGITGFNTYAFLRGFQNALLDFKLERDRACTLLDMIFDFEIEVIRLAAAHGFDGVHFADDWGTQQSLIVGPSLWRELFKPRYKRQFDVVHELGMHVWFHCCGNITEIVQDFHEIGVDVMNLSQPNAVDIDRVGKALRGRQCFMVPISYQTISISGTPEAIEVEARRLHRALGTPEGGFIGYVEEYSVMGMPEVNYRACARAFMNLQGETA